MNVQKAAEFTISLCAEIDSNRDEDGNSAEHAVWMLEGVMAGYIQGEKAHRWLGFAQGILVYTNKASLHDVKLANKRSKS